MTERREGRARLASTPGRLVSVARKLMPRLAEHVSPLRILSTLLRETSDVMAEEAALWETPCLEGESGESGESGEAGPAATGACAGGGPGPTSWGTLTSENVQQHEERSSPVLLPELLARSSAAADADAACDPLHGHPP